MLAGVAGGIGAIFKAPLAGALFAAEMLYRDPDFEHDAVIPGVISSVTAYSVFSAFYGYNRILQLGGVNAPDRFSRRPGGNGWSETAALRRPEFVLRAGRVSSGQDAQRGRKARVSFAEMSARRQARSGRSRARRVCAAFDVERLLFSNWSSRADFGRLASSRSTSWPAASRICRRL